MRSEAPPLLPLFRSRHQAELLTFLYLHPQDEFTLTDLAERLKIPFTTLHREAGRLLEAGILEGRRVGRAHLVRANASGRYARPLTELLTLSFGPHIILTEEFGRLPDTEGVALFGSWASRYEGVAGPQPNDLDVLIIGSPARGAVYEAADRAERRLDIPVNPVVVARSRWETPADPLVEQIRSAPLVWITEEVP